MLADTAPSDAAFAGQSPLQAGLARISADLWRDLDENFGRGWADRFTLTGVFDFNGAEIAGRDTLRAHFAKRETAPPRVTAHLLSNILVDPVVAGDTIVRAQICVFGADGVAPLPITLPTLVGLVEDRFEQQPDGDWLIARRSFIPRFYNPDDRVGRRVAGA